MDKVKTEIVWRELVQFNGRIKQLKYKIGLCKNKIEIGNAEEQLRYKEMLNKLEKQYQSLEATKKLLKLIVQAKYEAKENKIKDIQSTLQVVQSDIILSADVSPAV